MGSKIRVRKIPNLKARFLRASLGVGLVLCHGYFAQARLAIPEIIVQSEFRTETAPLTTESIWTLDPGQPNPHRQRWIDNRQSQLSELKASRHSNGKFGVTAAKVKSLVKGYVRGPGPWYQPYTDFSCEERPDSWFATEDGARRAAVKASDLWLAALKENEVQLKALLSRVLEDTEAKALAKGNEVFQRWLKVAEKSWRVAVNRSVRKAEWEFYLQEAAARGFCGGDASASNSGRKSWEKLMEAVPTGNPPTPVSLLARAPVKLWNGLYSVRVDIKISGKILNGRFLIDSGVNQSVISPTWLENQGIYPVWVEVPKAELIRTLWSDLWQGRKDLAKPAVVDGITVSGLDIPMTDFLLLDTDLFTPPENMGTCCDGVLGSDFLKLYPMEFYTGKPTELRIWPKEGFHWGPDVPWVEVSQDTSGDLVSACEVGRSGSNRGSRPKGVSHEGGPEGVRLEGVRWNTGSQAALNLHTPWASKLDSESQRLRDLSCDDVQVARNIQLDFLSRPAAGPGNGGPLAEAMPAVDVGMPLMSELKSITFDLPHGRVWLSKDVPIQDGILENKTGLKLKYEMVDGERVLKVSRIGKNSKAHVLQKIGLRDGTEITQIDSIPAEDIDEWEVNRRLAGYYGDTVTLQWRYKDTLKMAPLKLR